MQGPSASGIGAVQQYFEALGLTTPPKVQVRESAVFFECEPGGSALHTLEVAAVEKRPIFASAVSDQLWLKVRKIDLDGRTAHVCLAVDPAPDRPGESLDAKLTVRANGNQRFVIPVSLRILGKPRHNRAEGLHRQFRRFGSSNKWKQSPRRLSNLRRSPATAGGMTLRRLSVQKPPGASGLILPLLPVAFILFGLFIALARDMTVRVFAGGAERRNQ